MICQTRRPIQVYTICRWQYSVDFVCWRKRSGIYINSCHELNKVNNWISSNRICINADKTKYMIFSYRKLLYLTNIKITSATIEEINNIKFFGIIFDKHLTFKHHVDVIARKISKSVGILFKLSKSLPLEIIKALYYSLINLFWLYIVYTELKFGMAHMLT